MHATVGHAGNRATDCIRDTNTEGTATLAVPENKTENGRKKPERMAQLTKPKNAIGSHLSLYFTPNRLCFYFLTSYSPSLIFMVAGCERSSASSKQANNCLQTTVANIPVIHVQQPIQVQSAGYYSM